MNQSLRLHFGGGGLRWPHPHAIFQSFAKVFVNLYTRVRRRAWGRTKEDGTLINMSQIGKTSYCVFWITVMKIYSASKKLYFLIARGRDRDWWTLVEEIIFKTLWFFYTNDEMSVFTQWEDFPEENSKRPHVTLAGVHFVKDALWSHPL